MARHVRWSGSVLASGLTFVLVAAGIAVAANWDAGATVTAPARPVDRPPRTFSLVAVGDWLSESRVNVAAAAFAPPGVRMDHAPLLSPVQAIVASADLAICHMETPVSWPGDAYGFRGRAAIGGYTLIAAPFELAGDLRRVGFDRCSTASNHSWDLGRDGITSTLAALDAAGLSHVGTARTPDESAARTAWFEVSGVRVAHLSYTQTSNTGFPREPWLIDRGVDAATVAADVTAARAGGAEVVVVSWHVIAEMTAAPLPHDRAFVTELVGSADVDLVLIHGPHTVQPLEVVGDTPVFWSLGNVMSGMGVPGRDVFSDPRSLDGVLAAVRFTEQSDGTFTAEAAPVLLCQMAGSRVVHAGLAALASPATPANEVPGIAACIDRSAPVVAGLR